VLDGTCPPEERFPHPCFLQQRPCFYSFYLLIDIHVTHIVLCLPSPYCPKLGHGTLNLCCSSPFSINRDTAGQLSGRLPCCNVNSEMSPTRSHWDRLYEAGNHLWLLQQLSSDSPTSSYWPFCSNLKKKRKLTSSVSWWMQSGPVLSSWLLELELVPQKPAEASLKVAYAPNCASQPFKEQCCSQLCSSSSSSLRSLLGLGCLGSGDGTCSYRHGGCLLTPLLWKLAGHTALSADLWCVAVLLLFLPTPKKPYCLL